MRDFIDIAETESQYYELLNRLIEYQTIPGYNPQRPDKSNFIIVDRVTTSPGTIDVGENNVADRLTIAAILNDTVEFVIEFDRLSNPKFVIFRRAISYMPKRGLAASLFKWFKKTYNLSVFSDSQGEAFWKSLMKTYPSKVVNLQTRDGKTVIDPKDDNVASDLYLNDPNGQKWAYLIEQSGAPPKTPWGNSLPYEKGHGLKSLVPNFLVEGVYGDQID